MIEYLSIYDRKTMIDFKKGVPYAIEWFDNILIEYLNKQVYRPIIIPVPGHQRNKVNQVTKQAQRMGLYADHHIGLIRNKTVPPSCLYRCRSAKRFTDSVRFINESKIYRRHVIILDDVSASGATLLAARSLVIGIEHAPISITMLCLAKANAH